MVISRIIHHYNLILAFFKADSVQKYAGNRVGRTLTWVKDTIVIWNCLLNFRQYSLHFSNDQKTDCKIKMAIVSLINHHEIQLIFWSFDYSWSRNDYGIPKSKTYGPRMVRGWSKDGPRILDKESEFQNRLDLLSHDIRYFREQNQDSDHLQSQITII